MSTSSGEPGSTADQSDDTRSPYEIGLLSDDAEGADETGPKPLDPELQEEQRKSVD